MKKKIRFPTISLGSEPDQPDIDELAGFIRSHGPYEGDLITFKHLRSLQAQKDAKISLPCTGGLFCLPRIRTALPYPSASRHPDASDLIADAAMMTQISGSIHSALPAPQFLVGTSEVSDDEKFADYCNEFSKILRNMRDVHIKGHLLHAKESIPIELEQLVSRKTRFIIPDGTLTNQEALLEHQQELTISNSRMSLVIELIDQYEIRKLTIIEPDEAGYKLALEMFEVDQISTGGYGSGNEQTYWEMISSVAEIPAPQD